ncbi:MAG: hypothetical protein ACLGIS_10510 [Actinomycetes bacterium]
MNPARLIAALAVALPALGACGGPAAIDPGTAESFQQQVRELASLTQQGNLEGALEQADALKTEVQQAQDVGSVTAGRAGRIQARIDAFMESIQTAGTPATVAPSTTDQSATDPAAVPTPTAPPPEAEPAPAPPTFQAPAKGGREDSRDPGESQQDIDREAAEEAAEEAQKRAEKEAKEREKQQEEDREDD